MTGGPYTIYNYIFQQPSTYTLQHAVHNSQHYKLNLSIKFIMIATIYIARHFSSGAADAADTYTRRDRVITSPYQLSRTVANHTTTPRPSAHLLRPVACVCVVCLCPCPRLLPGCYRLPCMRVRVTFVSVCARSSVFLALA